MIPKAELHCHLEGAMPPALARRLASRYTVDIGDIFDTDGYYRWHDFSSFLAVYDQVAGLLKRPEDYRDLAHDYFVSMAGEGCIYGEVFASADHAARIGCDYLDMIEAIDAGMADAEDATGIVGRIVLTAIRHFGPEQAEETARLARDHPHSRVTGFGMAGEERYGRVSDYVRAFAIARDAGLQITVHAGELDGPQSVRDALDHIRPVRIGHGVRAIEDDDLVRRLADEAVVLEICPASNIAMKLYPDRAAHPFARLAASGVKVTLSSDDPPHFHTSIGGEYADCARHDGYRDDQLIDVTRQSVLAAFVDEETRADLLRRLDKAGS